MSGLTKRQSEILEYIDTFIKDHKFSPSYREIRDHFSFRSLGSVYNHIRVLKRKGVLSAEAGLRRSILPTKRVEKQVNSPEIELPFIGHVEKGQAIELFSHSQKLGVPEFLVHSPDSTYVIRVRGNGFQNELIADGDLILVEARSDPMDGETVLGYLNGRRAFILKYYPEGNTVRLEGKQGESISMRAGSVSVQGVITGLLRLF